MKTIICGALGKMGRVLTKEIERSNEFDVACLVDKFGGDGVYKNIGDFEESADVIIDFSDHEATDSLVLYATDRNIPLVIGTTGHSREELKLISSAAERIPIIMSDNFSIEICEIIRCVKSMLKQSPYHVEITEYHCNSKKDMPSGTSLMISEKLQKYSAWKIKTTSYMSDVDAIYHNITVLNENSKIEFIHKVYDRSLFAIGALKAAKYAICALPGLYEAENII